MIWKSGVSVPVRFIGSASCFRLPLLTRISDRKVRSANRPSMQLSRSYWMPDTFAYIIPFRTILGDRVGISHIY